MLNFVGNTEYTFFHTIHSDLDNIVLTIREEHQHAAESAPSERPRIKFQYKFPTLCLWCFYYITKFQQYIERTGYHIKVTPGFFYII